MIDFHQFRHFPVDRCRTAEMFAPGLPAVGVSMAQAISVINSWQGRRSGVATAMVTNVVCARRYSA